MQREPLEAVRARIKLAWEMRRVCGLFAIAGAFRIGRLIARRDAGLDDPDTLYRMACETEAAVLCFRPVSVPGDGHVSA